MAAVDSTTKSSVRRRSLALRTMAGVVAVVALALAALTVTTLGIAGHIVTSQLRDSLTESWRRTSSFVSNAGHAPGSSMPGFKDSGGAAGYGTGPAEGSTDPGPADTGSSPSDVVTKNPIDVPGLPVDSIAMIVGSDGTVTSAGRIDESGQRVDVDDETAAQLLEAVKLNDEASTSQGLFKEIDFSFGRYVIQAAPLEDGKGPGLADTGGYHGDGENSSSTAASGESPVSGESAAADGSTDAANTADTSSEGILILGISTAQADNTKARLLAIQLIGSFLALLAVGLGVWWWIRRSLRPLQQVSHVAAKVSEIPMASGDVDLHRYRVPDNLALPRDEVGDVGYALNRLIDSVDSALTERSASEAKLRTFVADASHELRTPLASVRGYAEMIQLTEALDENGEKLLQRVLHQSERMSALVENLLLLARLDAAEGGEGARAGVGAGAGASLGVGAGASTDVGVGQGTGSGMVPGGQSSAPSNPGFDGSNESQEAGAGSSGAGSPSGSPSGAGSPVSSPLQKSKVFDLGELVLDAVMDATAAGRHHEWIADIPDDPVLIRGDASQIAQLLGNLLSNARKHTPEGTSVIAQLAVETNHAVFTVTDTGPGIDPALIGKIFDRFVRGDSARTTSEGSTGLGLSIVRSVARAHGGEATVTSQPGNTEFRVVLPLAADR